MITYVTLHTPVQSNQILQMANYLIFLFFLTNTTITISICSLLNCATITYVAAIGVIVIAGAVLLPVGLGSKL